MTTDLESARRPASPKVVEGKTIPTEHVKQTVIKPFLTDPGWEGESFWMLNLVKLKGGRGSDGDRSYHEYLSYRSETLTEVMSAMIHGNSLLFHRGGLSPSDIAIQSSARQTMT